jgi:hypothetical protein
MYTLHTGPGICQQTLHDQTSCVPLAGIDQNVEFHEVLGEKKMMYLNEACSELARNQVYPQDAREECLVEVPAD